MSAGIVERTGRSVAELANGIPGLRVVRGSERDVKRVRLDSRAVEPGDLFVAVRGGQFDGMKFANEALARGATGVVADVDAQPPATGAWLVAERPRQVAALLAARAFGDPSHRLDVIGVTGTNGKTTTTFLLRSIFAAAGRRPAVLGTLGAFLPGREHPQERTTPEAPELQASLLAAAEAGADVVAMEVSSHALDLYRVDGTRFAACAFLNLTPEHLDWHHTMEAYAQSKRRLFADLLGRGDARRGPRAILAAGDPWSDVVGADHAALRFGLDEGADIRARDVEVLRASVSFRLETPDGAADVQLPLPGEHNVKNALAAAGLAWTVGVPTDRIAAGLDRATAPPGRFERVHAGTFDAWVDYAHTEDGVRRALEVARKLGTGRVLVIMGCGGDRDRGKRATMGGLAAALADVAVFTSDNPRTEDPVAIVEEMLGGVADRAKVRIELDRERALAWAVEAARPGDVVLALGKGHERYQEVAGVKHPFDERAILARLASGRDSADAGGKRGDA